MLFEEDALEELPNLAKGKANILRAAGIVDVSVLKGKTVAEVQALCKASKGISEKTGLPAHAVAQTVVAGNDNHLHCDYWCVGGVRGAAKSDNPWREKFGPDGWRAAVAKHLRGGDNEASGHACVTELVTHMMLASAAAMKGTTHEKDSVWLLYHDALVQLTDEKTKAWMKTEFVDSVSFFDRWLIP